MPEKVLRLIFILLFTVLGVVLSRQGESVLTALLPSSVLTETILGITFMSLATMLLGGILGAVVGCAVSPYLISRLFALTSRMEKSLSAMSTQDLIAGTLGLFLGLIIANLVGLAFSSVPFIGPYVSVVLSIVLGYLGMHLAVSKKPEMVGWFKLHAEEKSEKKKSKEKQRIGKLLDTNIIIDGRVADIFQTGFLEGPIVVPVFVLEELQKIADSSDVLKRNRGRRGLDILNHMRKKNRDEEISEVDSKLIKLAREKGYKIITNDYNLNKVAELQGVAVLNVNDLAIAVKPAVIPGEQIFVQLVKNGKEEGQGVAYLDDGTMIVVEDGSKSIGKEVAVIITSVLQTSAGKMIFAKLEE